MHGSCSLAMALGLIWNRAGFKPWLYFVSLTLGLPCSLTSLYPHVCQDRLPVLIRFRTENGISWSGFSPAPVWQEASGGLGGWGELELDLTNPLVSLPSYGVRVNRFDEDSLWNPPGLLTPAGQRVLTELGAGGSLRARRWSLVWIVQQVSAGN